MARAARGRPSQDGARSAEAGGVGIMAQSFLPVLNEVEKASLDERQPLPARYRGLSDEEMDRRITAARATLGSQLLILGLQSVH